MYLYVIYDQEYKRELEKIEFLERKKLLKEKKLEQIRERTTPCHITELDTPRRCYFDSNYKCSWNESAERCDAKN